jgi:hypothetical protein
MADANDKGARAQSGGIAQTTTRRGKAISRQVATKNCDGRRVRTRPPGSHERGPSASVGTTGGFHAARVPRPA